MTCTDKAAEIRPGDAFELRCEAQRPDKHYPSLWECRLAGVATFFITSDVLLAGRRVARPLAVGDYVLRNHAFGLGRIVAIESTRAWVKWSGPPSEESYATSLLSDLEIAPAPDTKEGTA